MGRGSSKVGNGGIRYGKQLNDEQLRKLANGLGQEQGDLTFRQMDAADHYFQTSESFRLNKKLRQGGTLDAQQTSTVDGLSSAMKPLPYNVQTVRFVGNTFLKSVGMDGEQLVLGFKKDGTKKLIGTEFSTPQFTSMSIDVASNVFKGSKCELDLRVKKGTNVFVNPHRRNGRVPEGEILLDRNVPMKIVGAENTRWNVKLIVEVG